MIPHSSRRGTRWLPILLPCALLATLLYNRPAHVQSYGQWGDMHWDGTASIGAGIVAGAFVPPTVVNTIYATKGKRPPLVWPILGYLFGTAEMALAIGEFDKGGSGSASGSSWDYTNAGAIYLSASVLNLGTATLALLMPRANPAMRAGFLQNVSVGPFIGKDIAGRPMNGATLSLTRF